VDPQIDDKWYFSSSLFTVTTQFENVKNLRFLMIPILLCCWHTEIHNRPTKSTAHTWMFS